MNGEPKAPGDPGSATASVVLNLGGERFEARLTVPIGPTLPEQLLPVLQPLAESLAGAAVGRVEAEGKRVSCSMGCGACCRQVVPIAPSEARRIARLVEELPEPRRTVIQDRFAAARARLAAAGLLEQLTDTERLGESPLRDIGLEYFRLGIACPFLENESCSIYADRPIACREYLVTSPPEHCARPSAETVRIVPLPAKVWIALARLEEQPGRRFVPWVPLALAPEWSRAQPAGPVPRAGTELLTAFFEKLAQKKKERG